MALQTNAAGDAASPYVEETQALVTRWVGISALVTAVFGGVMAFGSVEAWAWGALWLLSALAASCALLAWIIERRATIVPAPVLWLAILLAVAALFQIVPLPAWALRAAGTRAGEAYAVLFGTGGHAVSLAPGETLVAFLKITAALMASFATLALARTRGMLFALVAAAGLAALAAAAVGVMQENGTPEKMYGVRDIAAGAEARYWRSAALDPGLSSGVARVDAVDGAGGTTFFRRSVNVGDVFGPYADSNHFGGLMEIALPVLLALFFALLETRRGSWREEGGFGGSTEGNLTLLMTFALALGVAATAYSGSIGAMGGLVAGCGVVFALALASHRLGMGVIVSSLALAAAGAVGAIVFRADAMALVAEKISERAEVWRSAWSAAKDFLILGGGLGTYSSIAPHYEAGELKYLFAHNDYLQFLLEAGIIVFLASAALVIWQMKRLAKGAFSKGTPYLSALAAGALGSMTAIAFHSFFDFNLHVPANALALAVLVAAGSVAAAAYPTDVETVAFRARTLFTGRGKATVAAAGTLILMLAGSAVLAATVRAEMTGQRAREMLAVLDDDMPSEAPRGLARVSADMSLAARLAPLDAETRYNKARLDWYRAGYEQDAAKRARIREASTRYMAEAARLAPAYTFYALSASTAGAPGRDVAAAWPMEEASYQRLLAAMEFERGDARAGLAAMKAAVALAVTDPAGAEEAVNGIVADLLRRLKTYESIAAAVPDTFGGHFAFANGLAAAGEAAAAAQEMTLAAECCADPARGSGLTERYATALADSLSAYGKPAEARLLYMSVLARYPNWQSLRLSYARYLAGQGSVEEASAEIEKMTSARIPQWLVWQAQALKNDIGRK